MWSEMEGQKMGRCVYIGLCGEVRLKRRMMGMLGWGVHRGAGVEMCVGSGWGVTRVISLHTYVPTVKKTIDFLSYVVPCTRYTTHRTPSHFQCFAISILASCCEFTSSLVLHAIFDALVHHFRLAGRLPC